jgi:hypothetical protein
MSDIMARRAISDETTTYEHEVRRRVAHAAERVAKEVGEQAHLPAAAAAGPHLARGLQALHGGAVAIAVKLPHRHRPDRRHRSFLVTGLLGCFLMLLSDLRRAVYLQVLCESGSVEKIDSGQWKR